MVGSVHRKRTGRTDAAAAAWRRQRGMTMPELMVALAIAGIALAGFATMMGRVSTSSMTLRAIRDAEGEALNLMGRLKRDLQSRTRGGVAFAHANPAMRSPPGTYSFEVGACAFPSIWSSHPYLSCRGLRVFQGVAFIAAEAARPDLAPRTLEWINVCQPVANPELYVSWMKPSCGFVCPAGQLPVVARRVAPAGVPEVQPKTAGNAAASALGLSFCVSASNTVVTTTVSAYYRAPRGDRAHENEIRSVDITSSLPYDVSVGGNIDVLP